MRKLLAIALLVVLGLPVVSPLFALSGLHRSRLPACCRRNGAHKCEGMDAAQMSADSSGPSKFRAPVEHCPYQPSALIAPHAETFATAGLQHFAWDVSRGVVDEVQARWVPQSTSETSHRKRGPPSLIL